MSRIDNKKVSQQFIEYLKETPINSTIKRAESKLIQNEKSKECKQKKYYGPLEGDFSKISNSYVLENNRLRKRSTEYSKNQIKKKIQDQQYSQVIPQIQENETIQLVKQRTKLQYLQKKGFLKPQEKARLQKIKSQKGPLNMIKQQPMNMTSSKHPNKQTIAYQEENPVYYKNVGPKKMMMRPINNENFNPNYHIHHPYHSGKGNIHNQNYYSGFPVKVGEYQNDQYYSHQQLSQGYQQNMQTPHQISYEQNNQYKEQNYANYSSY